MSSGRGRASSVGLGPSGSASEPVPGIDMAQVPGSIQREERNRIGLGVIRLGLGLCSVVCGGRRQVLLLVSTRLCGIRLRSGSWNVRAVSRGPGQNAAE